MKSPVEWVAGGTAFRHEKVSARTHMSRGCGHGEVTPARRAATGSQRVRLLRDGPGCTARIPSPRAALRGALPSEIRVRGVRGAPALPARRRVRVPSERIRAEL